MTLLTNGGIGKQLDEIRQTSEPTLALRLATMEELKHIEAYLQYWNAKLSNELDRRIEKLGV